MDIEPISNELKDIAKKLDVPIGSRSITVKFGFAGKSFEEVAKRAAALAKQYPHAKMECVYGDGTCYIKVPATKEILVEAIRAKRLKLESEAAAIANKISLANQAR